MLGSIISHYRVLDRLGGGGMGVVYRAEDTRLGRQVALKCLPTDIANDSAALERFRREARAASTINHANICTVYDIDESDSGPFLVMEMLEGMSLKQRIGGGHLLIDDVLDWALQITDGLEAAHAKGIVHRDLKPANLFITLRNQAKILDFGLAKVGVARHAFATSGFANDTRSLDFETSPGMTIGTITYMSPEQVRGEPLDGRSDIFSFGVVLYEMVTGKQPFAAVTSGLAFEAILNRMPEPVSWLKPAVPAGLEQIINRCLEKDKELRYQTVTDLRSDLKRLKRDSSSGHQIPVGLLPARRTRPWLAPAILVALAAGAAAGYKFLDRPAPAPQWKLRQVSANPSEVPVTGAAISPDGRYIAYSDVRGVRIHAIDTGDSQLIAGTDGLIVRTWTPDGTRVRVTRPEFGVRGDQSLISIVNGSRQPAPPGYASPDGKLIAEYRQDSKEVWLWTGAGEEPRLLHKFSPEEAPTSPSWSPDSSRVAYVMLRKAAGATMPGSSIETIDVSGGKPVTVVRRSAELGVMQSLVWLSDWRIVFSSSGAAGKSITADNLWAVPVDPPTGAAAARITRLTNWESFELTSLTASADGKRLALIRRTFGEDVYVGRLSENGTVLATPERFTMDERLDMPTGWSADSKTVYFASNRGGEYNIYRQDLGHDAAVPLVAPTGSAVHSARTTYTGWVVFHVMNSRANPADGRLMKVPAAGGAPVVLYRIPADRSGFNFRCAHTGYCVVEERTGNHSIVSELNLQTGKGRQLFDIDAGGDFDIAPDGSWLARIQPPTPANKIGIYSLDGKLQREIKLEQVNLGSLDVAANGEGFYTGSTSVASGATLLYVSLKGQARPLWRQPGSSRIWGVPSPDGNNLAVFVTPREANVFILENP